VVYVNQTLARLKAIPGVETAAFVAPMPFSGGNVGSDFRIEGQPALHRVVNPRQVIEVLLRVLRFDEDSLIKGRFFTDQDKRGQLGAAIINGHSSQDLLLR
jgi:hypothetical protein